MANLSEAVRPGKPAGAKRRPATISQILKQAYLRHSRDRDTRSALRHCLRD